MTINHKFIEGSERLAISLVFDRFPFRRCFEHARSIVRGSVSVKRDVRDSTTPIVETQRLISVIVACRVHSYAGLVGWLTLEPFEERIQKREILILVHSRKLTIIEYFWLVPRLQQELIIAYLDKDNVEFPLRCFW